jgi:GDP-L-fucose synthase
MNEYKNKKVLVTGGTGLIGRQVVDLLVNEGADVTVLGLDDLKLNNKVFYRKFDLSCSTYFDSFNELQSILSPSPPYWQEWDYIFHLAGIKASPKITLERPATMSITPLMINTNVLEACRINGIKNVLFTSSIGAYSNEASLDHAGNYKWNLAEDKAYLGEPMDFYPGMVKRMAEYQIQSYEKEFSLNYCVMRLTNNFGIGDNFNPDNGMFISSLMAKVLRGDNPVEIWGDGSNIRDFAYSKDTARGILHMMLNHKDTQPINLGGTKASVKEIVETLQSIVPFEAHYNPQQASGIKERVLDTTKALNLGYKPSYTLYESLKETWDWYVLNSLESEKRLNYFENK